jgi:transmembrane sensor
VSKIMKSRSQIYAETSAIEWLAKLNAEELSLKQQQEFTAWLEASSIHQVAYIKAEQLWERGAVLQRLPERASSFWAWRAWGYGSTLRYCGAACSVAVLVAFTFFAFGPSQDLSPSFETAIGEVSTITLVDGSVISVNTNSRIHFDFSGRERMAYLDRGEVFFDVKADSEHPFMVVTHDGVVRVVGTRFSVQGGSANSTKVTVVEGSVALGELQTDKQNTFVPVAVLEQDERTTFEDAITGVPPSLIDANAALSWRKQRLIYRAEPLSKVVADLNRFIPQQIVLGAPSLADKKITAVIQLTQSGLAVEQLGLAFNLKVELDPDRNSMTFYPAD